MKEHDFIKIIQNQTQSQFLGDDCACLEKFGIVITQDNFIEDIHFKRNWATPYQIGYKAAAVNISDVLASGAKPEYITVGLSIPDLGESFIKEFYRGIEAASYGAKVVGGDITGADKIFISICAIGSTEGRKISSRKNAKPGYVVITHGKYGESSKGLKELLEGKQVSESIKTHLEPELNPEFSKSIAEQIQADYAMMDTSDGLADALFKIAEAGNVSIVSEYIDGMFGFEDYHLVAAVPETFLDKLSGFYLIGKVVNKQKYVLKIGEKEYLDYDELNLYNHFGRNNE